jgi:hypothetical protein
MYESKPGVFSSCSDAATRAMERGPRSHLRAEFRTMERTSQNK